MRGGGRSRGHGPLRKQAQTRAPASGVRDVRAQGRRRAAIRRPQRQTGASQGRKRNSVRDRRHRTRRLAVMPQLAVHSTHPRARRDRAQALRPFPDAPLTLSDERRALSWCGGVSPERLAAQRPGPSRLPAMLGSLAALHRAVAEARRTGAELLVVLASEPPEGRLRLPARTVPAPADRGAARERLLTALDTAFGGTAPGIGYRAGPCAAGREGAGGRDPPRGRRAGGGRGPALGPAPADRSLLSTSEPRAPKL